MLKFNYQRSYKKLDKKGNPITMFVYGITGTEAQLQEFKDAQGEFYREDEAGDPIWFSSRYVGETGKLIITSNGKVVPDTSEYDKAASIVKQYGGNLGQAIANAYATKLVGGPVEVAPAPVTITKDDDGSLDKE